MKNDITSFSPTASSKLTTQTTFDETNLHKTVKPIHVITPTISLKQTFIPFTTITSENPTDVNITLSDTKSNQSDSSKFSKTQEASSQFHDAMTSLLDLIDQSEASLRTMRDEPISDVDSTVSKRDIEPSQTLITEVYTESVDGVGGKGVTPPPTVQLDVKFMKQLDHLDEYMVNISKVDILILMISN